MGVHDGREKSVAKSERIVCKIPAHGARPP